MWFVPDPLSSAVSHNGCHEFWNLLWLALCIFNSKLVIFFQMLYSEYFSTNFRHLHRDNETLITLKYNWEVQKLCQTYFNFQLQNVQFICLDHVEVFNLCGNKKWILDVSPVMDCPECTPVFHQKRAGTGSSGPLIITAEIQKFSKFRIPSWLETLHVSSVVVTDFPGTDKTKKTKWGIYYFKIMCQTGSSWHKMILFLFI